MLNHVFVTVLLSSFGIRCLVAEPCTRLYMQGLHATNYPQLAGVYVLRNEVSFFSVFCYLCDVTLVHFINVEHNFHMLLPKNSCGIFGVALSVERWAYDQEVVGSSLSRAHGVKTLDKFLTLMCLCHQAVKVGTGLRAVTPYGWEGNCGPGQCKEWSVET